MRFRTQGPDQFGQFAAVIGQWAEGLRHEGLASGLAFDVYAPETGRYGYGAAMEAAEAVFCADSQAVTASLGSCRPLPSTRGRWSSRAWSTSPAASSDQTTP